MSQGVTQWWRTATTTPHHLRPWNWCQNLTQINLGWLQDEFEIELGHVQIGREGGNRLRASLEPGTSCVLVPQVFSLGSNGDTTLERGASWVDWEVQGAGVLLSEHRPTHRRKMTLLAFVVGSFSEVGQA